MQPDSQRQWFVYYKEKEIGPISEKELHSKIKSGDLDSSAYVFTEGMSDWALISDTPVLAQSAAAAAQPVDDLKGFSDETPHTKSKASQAGLSVSSGGAAVQPQVTKNRAPSGASQASFTAPQPSSVSQIQQQPKGQTQTKGVTNTKSVNLQASKVDVTKAVKVGVPSKAKGSSMAKVDLKDPAQRTRLLVLVVLLVVIGVAGAVGSGLISIPGLGEFVGPAESGKEPLPSNVPSEVKEKDSQQQAEQQQESPAAETNAVDLKKSPTTSESNAQAAGDWESALQQFRLVKDPKGSVAMIARASIGAKFPIFVGSLSPLLGSIRELAVAVYPDNEKNIMALPRLWFFRVPVNDGWFTIGPLSNADAPLPAGRYVITLMAQGKAFDDQIIDVGTWPTETELAKIRSQLAVERSQAAAKEKADFGPRFKAAVALEKQLLVRSVDARKQKKGRSAWTSFSRAWYKDNEVQLKEANALASGPTFYPDAQRKLAAYVEALRGLYETYEIVSKEGPKALKKAGRKNEEQQRMSITRLNTDLSGLATTLEAPDKIEAFKLNPNVVKESLRAFEQSAKELTQ